MSPTIRDLFLKVHGGDQYNLPFLFVVYQHTEHEAILRHLLKQDLRGWKLSDYISTECHGSPIHFIGKITKAIANTNTPPPLIAGVNFSKR